MTIAPGSNNPQDDLFEDKAQLERICRDMGRYSELPPAEQIKKCSEHAMEVMLFFESIEVVQKALGSDPLTKMKKNFPSAVVTLADAATMCGFGPRELWDNYVQPGELRLYNSDKSATDFLKQTLRLEEVLSFYCQQELEHRRFSCQDIIIGLLKNKKLNREDARLKRSALSSYLKMSSTEAIVFESAMVILARYIMLYCPKHHSAPEKGNGATVNSNKSFIGAILGLLSLSMKMLETLVDTIADLVKARNEGKKLNSTNATPPPTALPSEPHADFTTIKKMWDSYLNDFAENANPKEIKAVERMRYYLRWLNNEGFAKLEREERKGKDTTGNFARLLKIAREEDYPYFKDKNPLIPALSTEPPPK